MTSPISDTAKNAAKGSITDVLDPIKKLFAFASSEPFKIFLAVAQGLILPFGYVLFQYFSAPAGTTFLECVPMSLYIAPLMLARSLLPRELDKPANWRAKNRPSTLLKTLVGAFLLGLGILSVSMLGSRMLFGGFGAATKICSALSIGGALAAIFFVKDTVSLLDEKKSEGKAECRRRDHVIVALIALLFVIPIVGLFGGLVASFITLVVGVGLVGALATLLNYDGDESPEEPVGDPKKDESKADTQQKDQTQSTGTTTGGTQADQSQSSQNVQTAPQNIQNV
jgi:hypothetical protein